MTPEWLPRPLQLSGSSIENDYKKLYGVFEQDFIKSPPAVVDSCEVIVNNQPDLSIMQGMYTHGFTHMITHGDGERFIDYDRAIKLPWVRAVLDNYTTPEVMAFCINQIKGETVYLWLPDSDFVVVLRALKSKRAQLSAKKIIVTAYNVYPYGRKDLQRLYGRSTRQL